MNYLERLSKEELIELQKELKKILMMLQKE